jgi:hypothetical protein
VVNSFSIFQGSSMRRFRFTISSLLILVLFLGIGFAALREANDLWDSGVLTLTIGALLVSVLLAIHRSEKRRAYWVGFALFGWGYLGLTSIPSIESRLLTTKALACLDSKVPGRPTVITGQAWGGPVTISNQNVQAFAFSPQGNVVASTSPTVWRIWNANTGGFLGGGSGTTENFLRVGHSLLALITAWLGGRLSRSLAGVSRIAVPVPTSLPVSPANDSGI